MLEAWFYMTNVLLRDADQMGMAHSLEIRVPLLDPALAATAVWGLGDSFPASAVAKPSLVHAVRDDHLTSLASRKKRGFTLPLASWLREPRGLTALRALAGESAGGMFAFAPNSVRTSIDRFQSQGGGVYSMLALVTAGRWIARHGVTA
jgi:asparagine synthase (glutamine-hydrolysing)